jgi:hypothetical protein
VFDNLTMAELVKLVDQERDLFGFDAAGWLRYSKHIARRCRMLNEGKRGVKHEPGSLFKMQSGIQDHKRDNRDGWSGVFDRVITKGVLLLWVAVGTHWLFMA